MHRFVETNEVKAPAMVVEPVSQPELIPVLLRCLMMISSGLPHLGEDAAGDRSDGKWVL